MLTLGGQPVKKELLDLEDAALVWDYRKGKIKVQQSFSATGRKSAWVAAAGRTGR